MYKIWLIFKREYLTRIKKWSFIITTLLIPFSFIFIIAVPILLNEYSTHNLRIAVKDDTHQLAYRIKDTDQLKFLKQASHLSLADLQATYQENNFDGVLYIPQLDIKNPNGIVYTSNNALGLSAKLYIERELAQEIRKMRLTEAGVNRDEYQRLIKVNINVVEQLGDDSGMHKGSTEIATAAGMFMGFLMYMVIFIYRYYGDARCDGRKNQSNCRNYIVIGAAV